MHWIEALSWIGSGAMAIGFIVVLVGALWMDMT